ncbi:MAG: hypothetical protein ABIM88_01305 [candidate division WOR-3 bacterium]
MKKLLSLVVLLGLAVSACNKAPISEGSVTIWRRYAVAQGDSLKIEWLKVDGTDGYVLYDNSSGTLQPIDTLEGDTILSYVFGTVCTQVGVSTILDGELGDPGTVDLSLTALDTTVLYSRNDPDTTHYGYFRVDLNTGDIILVDSAHRYQSYGFLKGPQDTITFHSSYILYENDAGVRLYRETTASSLDEMTKAPAPSDSGWSTVNFDSAGVALAAGDLFYFWVDECGIGAPGWTSLDLFGKMEVLSVSGYTVTVRCRWQTGVFALRWLK